ncbi:MAG TPA: protease pro-enzyme activation domain-containing protein, partial [Candidatus Tumulicola sp.]
MIAAAVGLSLALSACGGHGGSGTLPSLPTGAGADAQTSPAVTHSTLSNTPLVSVPQMYGKLAFKDAGRHPSNAIVRVSMTLRYNHQAQLDELVANLSDRRAGAHKRFLSPKEFNARFAPTPEQERSVVRALVGAGFKIESRFDNRTIVDATARTSVVERFFATEIHSVKQGSYGDRYTNVKQVTVPSAIAPYVRDVSVNNLVVVRTVDDQSTDGRTLPKVQTDARGRTVIPLRAAPMDSTGNLVNGGFET